MHLEDNVAIKIDTKGSVAAVAAVDAKALAQAKSVIQRASRTHDDQHLTQQEDAPMNKPRPTDLSVAIPILSTYR